MDVKKSIAEYDRRMAQDKKLAELDRQAKEGLRKWQAAEEFASRSGMTTAEVLISGFLEEFPDGRIPEDVARAFTVPLMKHNYECVSETAESAQTATNEAAGVALKALTPEFSKDRAEGIAKNIASWDNLAEHKDQVAKEVENNSRSIIDDAIRVNASAQESAGLKVSVTRIYDGVGLSNGRTCEWCLERCGTNMSYSEAYEKGAFQRHPGCGCELLYSVGKRTQRQKDWRTNTWKDVDKKEIEDRKQYGLEKDVISPQERIVSGGIKFERAADGIASYGNNPFTDIDYASASMLSEGDARLINDLLSGEYSRVNNAVQEILDKEKYGLPESHWSGRTIVADVSSMPDYAGAKEYNCDITIRSDQKYNIKTYIHENLHARSISRFPEELRKAVYDDNRNIEEGTIEYLSQEICKQSYVAFEGTYKKRVDAIREIKNIIASTTSDIDFAKKLIVIPLDERYNYLYSLVKDYRATRRVRDKVNERLDNSLFVLSGKEVTS